MTGAEKRRLARKYREMTMVDFVVEHRHQDINIPGSSDVGDCSHVVPTAQFVGACFTPGTPAHSWQMVAQGKSGTAVKGMLYAAQVLAHAGRQILDDPQIRGTCQGEIYSGNRRKTLCLPHPF